MKNLEKNKIFASIIFAFLVVAFSSNAIDVLFKPEKVIDAKFSVDHGDTANNTTTSSSTDVEMTLEALLQNSDIVRGKKTFVKCASCHNAAPNAGNKIGPNLWGVYGSHKAHLGSGFAYSKAMLASPGIWDEKSLFEFITSPRNYVPSTKMSFIGIKNRQQVADVISYLKTLK